jgi:hypothetical protein
VPRGLSPVLQADAQAYWQVRFGPVAVVQSADPLIRRLDYELLHPAFSLIGALLLVAAALAELLAGAVERELLGVIRPLQGRPNAEKLPDLGGSAIRELQVLVELVNRRTRRTREPGCGFEWPTMALVSVICSWSSCSSPAPSPRAAVWACLWSTPLCRSMAARFNLAAAQSSVAPK